MESEDLSLLLPGPTSCWLLRGAVLGDNSVTFGIHKNKHRNCPATSALKPASHSAQSPTAGDSSEQNPKLLMSPHPSSWLWMLGQGLFRGLFVSKELRCTQGLGVPVRRAVTQLY